MSAILADSALADRGPFGDVQLWALIIFAIVGAIVNIIKKIQGRRQRDQGGPGAQPTGSRPSSSLPSPSAPPRIPQAPRDRPPTMPTTTRPAPPVMVVVREAGMRERSAAPPVTVIAAPQRARAGRALGSVPLARQLDVRGGAGSRLPPPAEPRQVSAVPPAGDLLDGAAATRAEVAQMLRDRSGLQAALVLSEILAPPLGLRDER